MAVTITRDPHTSRVYCNAHQRPWTRPEELLLARAYTDLALTEDQIQAHLHQHGYARSIGAIQARLRVLGLILYDWEQRALRASHRDAREYLTRAKHLAMAELRHQITLARLEAPLAPIYKPDIAKLLGQDRPSKRSSAVRRTRKTNVPLRGTKDGATP